MRAPKTVLISFCALQAGKTGIRKKRTAKDPLKTSFVIGQEGASIMEVRAARRAKKEEKKMRRKR